MDKAGVSTDGILSSKPTLTVWYTEEKLEDYLSAMALEYQDATGVRVVPVLKSGLEYLEAVNDASIAEESMPDVYLISNDGLEKAYLAGLAVNVKDQNAVLNTENFPQTALDAVTYQGHAVAYPLYFETSALVYNQTYLEQAAAELETDEVSLIPKTIEDIRNFADEYNAPETVESVFRWDVSDFFYNYFFAGNYITVGGSCGMIRRINIYNQDAVYGLAAYQKLSQFFSIDAATSSYDQVGRILDGKLVYTIAPPIFWIGLCRRRQTEALWNTAQRPCRISVKRFLPRYFVTGSIVVNGYGKHQDEADNFAAWLCTDSADKLFDRSTLVPAKKSAAQQTEEMAAFWQEYSQTVPVPKLMATANFWVQMEIAETKIWEGENVSDVLKDLSEKIMTQVTGTQYVEEEYIEVPTETQIDYAESEEE
ncbi:MAG: sugar ABC transporter substrate-binding protein [Gallintestinimicrobium sp.]